MQEYHWDIRNRSRMGHYLTSIETDFARQVLDSCPHVHFVLDIGGGSGRLAIPLALGGHRVIVTESDIRPLTTLRQASSIIKTILVDSRSKTLPFQSSSIDCMLAVQIPFLTEDWFLPECSRVLAPQGFILLNAANAHSYKGLLLRLQVRLRRLVRLTPKRNTYGYSVRDIMQVVESHGMKIEKAVGYNWLPAQRASEARWIPYAARIEQRLGLRRLTRTSPWVLFLARNVASPDRGYSIGH